MADDGPAFVVCAGLSAVVGRAATSTMAQLRFRAPVRGKRPRVAIHERARGVRMESDIGYVPSEDDRPIGSSGNIPTELTLSQQLLMKQYEEQVERMSKAECQDLALEIARQMMVKDNILRSMLKKDFNTGIEPPVPTEFLEEGEGSGGGK